jgi:hypothetical protein
LFTEIVENPVEKILQSRIATDQFEEFSGLHHRGAVDSRVNTHRLRIPFRALTVNEVRHPTIDEYREKSTDYTVTTS